MLKTYIKIAVLASSCSIFPQELFASVITSPIAANTEANITFNESASYVENLTQYDRINIGNQKAVIKNGSAVTTPSITGPILYPLKFDINLSAINKEVDFEFVEYEFNFNLTNLSEDYKSSFHFSFDYKHQVFASADELSGGDAFADSSIELFDSEKKSLVSSYIQTSLNDSPLTFSDSHDFSITVKPGETASFSGLININAYSTLESGLHILSKGYASLKYVNFKPVKVPSPSTLWTFFLLGFGILIYRKSGNSNTQLQYK